MGSMSVEGVLRASTSALWTNGSSEVKLRLPGPAVSGSEAEQLGLGTPAFQDLTLGLAVWRKLGVDNELLVGARGVIALLESRSVLSAKELFQGAVGVVVGEVLYAITQCTALSVGGSPCAYRLRVEAPKWN